MGWFFTKAALLTFGGAYAVLPYVFQGAVEHYQLAHRGADDRRPRAGRDHAGPADHGRRLRRLRRRLDHAALFGAEALFAAGLAAALVVTLLHLPALVRLHLRRRTVRRNHARQPEVHRAALRHHGGGGRRDPQPGAVLRLSRALAGGP